MANKILLVLSTLLFIVFNTKAQDNQSTLNDSIYKYISIEGSSLKNYGYSCTLTACSNDKYGKCCDLYISKSNTSISIEIKNYLGGPSKLLVRLKNGKTISLKPWYSEISYDNDIHEYRSESFDVTRIKLSDIVKLRVVGITGDYDIEGFEFGYYKLPFLSHNPLESFLYSELEKYYRNNNYSNYKITNVGYILNILQTSAIQEYKESIPKKF